MTVLSLVELCTLAIRNGIEDGSLRLMHETLPLDIRRCIFNAIAMNSTFDNPNCIDLIARPEFLDGFATFDMKFGKMSTEEISPTSELLGRIIPVFATVSNGTFFGSNITDLRVPIYYAACGLVESWGTTLPTIIRLVAECRTLKKLFLRVMDFAENVQPSFSDEERQSFGMLTDRGPNLMNISDSTLPWVPVLENLEKLVITSDSLVIHVLSPGSPIIPFKRLSSLHLSGCIVAGLAWQNFLRMVQPTLKTLRMVESRPWPVAVGIIPLPMPVLEKLTIRDGANGSNNALGISVSNMSNSPRLTDVHLEMNAEGVSQSGSETTASLARIPNLDLAFPLVHDQFKIIFGLEPNQYRFISTFSSRIREVILMLDIDYWTESDTVALSRMIHLCHDLTTFEFVERSAKHPEPIESARAEFESSKQHLVRLFGDKMRTSKLVSMYIGSDLDEYTLNMISENCTNLKRLRIERCSQLSDRHLLTMARRGVVLSKIHVRECPNIRAEGLLALITNSGSVLEEFSWDNDDKEQQESVEMVLMRNCKYAKHEFKLDHVKQLASNHCFYIGSDCPSDDVDIRQGRGRMSIVNF